MSRNFLIFLFVLISINISAQTGWHFVQGRPQSVRFQDASFDEMSGWIVKNASAVDTVAIIYKTTDGGNTWLPEDSISNLNTFMKSMEFISDSIDKRGTLTNGTVAFDISRMPDGGIAFTPDVAPEHFVKLKIWPTPADEEIYMRFVLKNKSNVKYRLLNAQMKTVMKLPDELLDSGEYLRRFFRTGDLSSDIYYVVISTKNNHLIEKVVIKH